MDTNKDIKVETVFSIALVGGVLSSVAAVYNPEKRYWLTTVASVCAGVILNYTLLEARGAIKEGQ